jgi:hypothetical protein
VYSGKSMSFLRLESAALTETDKTIVELKRQLKERDKKVVSPGASSGALR